MNAAVHGRPYRHVPRCFSLPAPPLAQNLHSSPLHAVSTPHIRCHLYFLLLIHVHNPRDLAFQYDNVHAPCLRHSPRSSLFDYAEP